MDNSEVHQKLGDMEVCYANFHLSLRLITILRNYYSGGVNEFTAVKPHILLK